MTIDVTLQARTLSAERNSRLKWSEMKHQGSRRIKCTSLIDGSTSRAQHSMFLTREKDIEEKE